MDILLSQAPQILPHDTALAKRYVGLARKISMRTRVRIPREKKRYLCKNCHEPLVPGKNARVRLHPGNSRIIISCLSCGAVRRYPYRKPVKQESFR
jgi:ribonuclease P protein subunit RPR2